MKISSPPRITELTFTILAHCEIALKPSYELFWPKNYRRIKVITESPKNLSKNAKFVEEINNLSYAKTVFELASGFEKLKQGWGGHKKQQYDMFYADHYSSSDYIGFIDTDAVFLTPVDERMLFNGTKPIIKGTVGLNAKEGPHSFWSKVTEADFEAVGNKSVGNFMTYFKF